MKKSKDSRKSIQRKSHRAQLNYFWDKWMVDGLLNKRWPMLYASDINIDGNKMDSGFWMGFGSGLSTDDIINLKHQGVGQKLMTG